MLLPYGAHAFAWSFSNVGAPSTTPGTAVTPGVSNAEGAWTQLATAAQIANEVQWLVIWIAGGNATGVAKNHLFDLGVDVAGGTNYGNWIPIENLVCSQSDAAVAGGRWYGFPLRIPAGSSIAARIQGSDATAGTVRVAMYAFGQPTRPELWRSGSRTQTVGTITGSVGVSFTPGSSGAEGSWVSLGTIARPAFWAQLGVGINNGTTTSMMHYIDLAYGTATTKIMIIENYPLFLRGTAEQVASPLVMGWCDLPAGAELFVRGSSSGTPPTGFNAVAIVVG